MCLGSSPEASLKLAKADLHGICHANDTKDIYIYIYTRNFAIASLAQVPRALRAGFISEARLYRNHVCFRQSSQEEDFGRLLAICFSCLDRPWEGFLRTLAMRPLSHCQGSPEDTPKQFAMIFALHVVWERCWAGGEECARGCLPWTWDEHVKRRGPAQVPSALRAFLQNN